MRELSALIGPEYVLEVPAGSEYNRDLSRRRGVEGRADAVALPGSPEEVRALLAWCYEHDIPITPRGGGTGLTGGAAPVEGGVVCSLERLRQVREIDPSLWRMFPEAGVRTREVQRLAREHGLFFAPDPGAAEQSQIGGDAATNAGGPQRSSTGDGSWVAGTGGRAGARGARGRRRLAAKDVSGYDLREPADRLRGHAWDRDRRAPAAAAGARSHPAAGAVPRQRDEGCAAVERSSGSGLRPSVLDFLEGEAVTPLAPPYPGARASAAKRFRPARASR